MDNVALLIWIALLLPLHVALAVILTTHRRSVGA